MKSRIGGLARLKSVGEEEIPRRRSREDTMVDGVSRRPRVVMPVIHCDVPFSPQRQRGGISYRLILVDSGLLDPLLIARTVFSHAH
jgi:hypothetical protein